MSSSKHDGAGVPPKEFQKIFKERKAVKDMYDGWNSNWRKSERRNLLKFKIKTTFNPAEKSIKRDRCDPTAILPKRIWQVIWGMLIPEDRGYMRHLQSVFDEIHSSDYSHDLYSEMGTSRNTLDEYEEVKPLIKKEEPRVPMHLEFREVAKRGQQFVDRFLKERFLESLQSRDAHSNPWRTCTFALTNSFNDLEKLNRVLVFTKPVRSENPGFFEKSITITVSTTEQFCEFRKKLTCLLQRIGDQIWHFRFHAFHIGGENDNGELYTAFIEWLSFMPCLKWLQLLHFCDGTSSSTSCEIPLLQPRLGNIERLDLHLFGPDFCKREVELLGRKILAANARVKTLNILGRAWNIIPTMEEGRALVETLSIKDEIFFDVMRSINISWPLSKMALRFDMEYDSINPLIQLLNNFPVLEELSLSIGNVTIGIGIEFLRLEKLSVLELEFAPKVIYNAPFQFFFNLQFLLYAKCLRKVKWTNYGLQDVDKLRGQLKRYKEQGNMIDFGGGCEDLTRSNIWTVFPQLKEVSTSVREVDPKMGLLTIVREYSKGKLVSEKVMSYSDSE